MVSLAKLIFGDEMGFSQLNALETETVIVWLSFSELYPDLLVNMGDEEKEKNAVVGRIAETFISYLKKIHENTNACILWVGWDDQYGHHQIHFPLARNTPDTLKHVRMLKGRGDRGFLWGRE